MEFLLAFATAMIVSVCATPLLVRYSSTVGLIDQPDGDRKVHADAIPCSGGLAIVLAVFASAIIWVQSYSSLAGLFAGMFIIAAAGYGDDRSNLDYRLKLLAQVVAAIVVMAGGVVIEVMPLLGSEPVSEWISYPITLLFIVGVVNACNFWDGLDGLAGGTVVLSLCLIAAFGFQTGNSAVTLLALTVAGGLFGFLRYNTHPAQIFMGDTGSQFIGIIVASLAIIVTQSTPRELNPALPIFIVGLPLLDAVVVITLRIVNRQFIFSPDTNHIHHQFIRFGFRHYQVVAILYVVQTSLLIVAWLVRRQADWVVLGAYAFFCAFSALTAYAISHQHRKRIASGEVAFAARDRRNPFFRRMTYLHRHGPTIVELVLAAVLILNAVFVATIVPQFSWLGPSIAAILALIWLVTYLLGLSLPRTTFFLAVVLLVTALQMAEPSLENVNPVIDAGFLGLLVFLILAIRVTRKELFRLDPQDVLVLCIVVTISLMQLTPAGSESIDIGRILLRLAILVYAFEFVLSKEGTSHRLVQLSAISSVALLSVPVNF